MRPRQTDQPDLDLVLVVHTHPSSLPPNPALKLPRLQLRRVPNRLDPPTLHHGKSIGAVYDSVDTQDRGGSLSTKFEPTYKLVGVTMESMVWAHSRHIGDRSAQSETMRVTRENARLAGPSGHIRTDKIANHPSVSPCRTFI